MTKAQVRSTNQEVLAHMGVLLAEEAAKLSHRPPPGHQLMGAVEEAIEDKRRQLAELASRGLAGSAAYSAGQAQLARWVEARRVNR